MEYRVCVIIIIILFIFNKPCINQTEPFTMENIGSFNPDGYGDSGVYFDRSGLTPRVFRIFPDIPLQKTKPVHI
jgi:hypothetical protein